MKSVSKLRRRIILLCVAVLFVLVAISLECFASNSKAFAAENVWEESATEKIENSSEVNPRGLYTHLSLSINGVDGRIWATVRNDFTLFPSTVIVIVELYSSDTYYESHTNMTLVSMKSIEDLNMGNSIVAEGSTGGVKKYWQGRMRYKIDNGGWKSETTGTMLYSADGTYLGLQ